MFLTTITSTTTTTTTTTTTIAAAAALPIIVILTEAYKANVLSDKTGRYNKIIQYLS